MLFTQFSISALNDWADADSDGAAARPRPIPLALLSRRSALITALACAALALIGSGLAGFGLLPLLLLVVGLMCGWLYDLALKRTPLSFVPFAIAFPLMAIWVGVIAQRPAASFPVIVIGGIPLAIAIHLADAIPDREHDAAAGVRTLAVRLGRPQAEIAALALLVAGTLVAGDLVIRRGVFPWPLLTPFLFAANYLLLILETANDRLARRRSVIAKWILLVGAINVALLLVLSA